MQQKKMEEIKAKIDHMKATLSAQRATRNQQAEEEESNNKEMLDRITQGCIVITSY
jgi:hypothetical protein